MVFKVISSFNSYYENCTLVFTVSIHGFIKESQYYYWLKTLRKEETGSGKLEQQASPFVELPVVCRKPQAPLQGGAATIIRKGDISIEVAEPASAGFFSKVMEALAYAQ